jgi:small subunit ribosomal protein S5
VGNGHGGIGVGMAKHRDAFHATRSALERAQRDMIHLAMHNGCLHHDLLGKKNGVHVLLRANPATGAVLKGAPAIVDVLELAGLKSASAKKHASTNSPQAPFFSLCAKPGSRRRAHDL